MPELLSENPRFYREKPPRKGQAISGISGVYKAVIYPTSVKEDGDLMEV